MIWNSDDNMADIKIVRLMQEIDSDILDSVVVGERRKKSYGRVWKRMGAAAAAVILTFTGLYQIPAVNAAVQSWSEEMKSYISKNYNVDVVTVSPYEIEVGQTVENNGVTITLDNVIASEACLTAHFTLEGKDIAKNMMMIKDNYFLNFTVDGEQVWSSYRESDNSEEAYRAHDFDKVECIYLIEYNSDLDILNHNVDITLQNMGSSVGGVLDDDTPLYQYNVFIDKLYPDIKIPIGNTATFANGDTVTITDIVIDAFYVKVCYTYSGEEIPIGDKFTTLQDWEGKDCKLLGAVSGESHGVMFFAKPDNDSGIMYLKATFAIGKDLVRFDTIPIEIPEQ